jgi:hypothetical protein
MERVFRHAVDMAGFRKVVLRPAAGIDREPGDRQIELKDRKCKKMRYHRIQSATQPRNHRKCGVRTHR